MKITLARTATPKILVALILAAAIGCKHEGATGTEPTTRPPAPRATSPAITELLAAVPGNAVALGFVDTDVAPWALLTGGLVPLDAGIRKSLDKELREYVDRYLGLDLSRLQYAVGFVSGSPARGAVVLKTIGGTLKMPGATEYDGGKVWAVNPDIGVSLALKGDIVVFGKDEAVRDVLDTMTAKRAAVTVENKALVEWLRTEGAGAALAFAAVKPKDVPLPPPIAGLERVAVSIGVNGVTAVVDGSDAAISTIQTRADQAIAKALAEIEQAHHAAIAGDMPPPQGAIAIIAAAYANDYAAKLKPRRDGNRLSVSLRLGGEEPDGMMIVAGIGVMAAVAIPAFIDYTKRSEAAQHSLQGSPL